MASDYHIGDSRNRTFPLLQKILLDSISSSKALSQTFFISFPISSPIILFPNFWSTSQIIRNFLWLNIGPCLWPSLFPSKASPTEISLPTVLKGYNAATALFWVVAAYCAEPYVNHAWYILPQFTGHRKLPMRPWVWVERGGNVVEVSTTCSCNSVPLGPAQAQYLI